MLGWMALVVFILLAVYNSPWWWMAVAPAVLWKAHLWYFYKGRPWRRVHYPAMRAYARACGAETFRAEREGRDFDVRSALVELLRLVRPAWDPGSIDLFIEREFDRCANFTDRGLIEEYIRKRARRVDQGELDAIMRKIASVFDSRKSWLMVRMVVAGLVEEQYGEAHRAEYLVEVLTGNAN
ncbi:MAG: hypothetical protein H5U02_05000 [Clostridia bacterium]|nr:hypothetical protein [Clostridia bacterium]